MTFGKWARWTSLLLASTLLMTASAQAQGDAGDGALRRRALELVEEGQALYMAERYEAAIAVLEQAYIVYPDPTIQYNIARSFERLGRPGDAADRYALYLQGVGANAPDRAQVEARIASLRRAAAEAPPSEPDGERVSRPTGDEQRSSTRSSATDQPRSRSPLASEPRSNGPRHEGTSLGWWPWALGGVGVATIATGLFVGIAANEAHEDAMSAPSHQEAVEGQQDAEDLATTTNILLIVGGAIAAVATGVLVIDGATGGEDSSESSRSEPRSARRGAGFSVRF